MTRGGRGCAVLRFNPPAPGLAHAFNQTPPLGADCLVVGARHAPESADRKSRIERQSGRDRGSRLAHLPELREGGSKMEMRERKISVGLDRTTQPCNRLLVLAKTEPMRC